MMKKGLIKTIDDILKIISKDIKYLKLTLGKMGETLWNFANGLDSSEVSRVDDKDKIIKTAQSLLNESDEYKKVLKQQLKNLQLCKNR